MEGSKIENEIKLCEVKRESLLTTMEKVKSVASDLLLITLQWKDLEDYQKSVGNELLERFKELVSREIEIENSVKLCEVKRESLLTTMEKLKSVASDLLLITLQWKDLEDYQKSVGNELMKRFKELVSKEMELQRVEECRKTQELDSEQKLSSELICKEKKLQETVKSLNEEMEEICKEIESKAKKLKDIEWLIEEGNARCESINLLIEEHNEELASKEKKQNEMSEAVHKLTAELKSKECELNSVKKNIQDFQSKEEQQVRLEASLIKREKEFGLKEKELDAREERIDDKDQQLKSMEQKLAKCDKDHEKKLAKCVKDYEQKLAKCVNDYEQKLAKCEIEFGLKEKELNAQEEWIDNKEQQLKSMEHKLAKCDKDYEQKLAKCEKEFGLKEKEIDAMEKWIDNKEQQLKSMEHKLDKCDKDYEQKLAKCVKDYEHKLAKCEKEFRLKEKKLDALEVTMDNKDQDLKSMEQKLVKCVEDYEQKLANCEKEFNLKEKELDAREERIDKKDQLLKSMEHKLATCVKEYEHKAKKLSSFCQQTNTDQEANACDEKTENNVLPMDDKLEQPPPEASYNSHLADEDALKDLDGSASFSPNEVLTGLRYMKDPGSYVLNLVSDALMDARQRGELGLAEAIVKTLIPLFEELPRVVTPSEHLKAEARKVTQQWSLMMGNTRQMSPLEAWGFLQFIVAYELADSINQNETIQFASNVAHFRQAPKLFQSLGLSFAIPNFVKQLRNKRKIIEAMRFMFYFNMNPPLELLKEEIINLRQVKERDAGRKLRDIIELIEDFNLEIDLPVDLIIKFMVPREAQNQIQCDVPLSQASESTVVQAQSSHQYRHKRPRVLEPRVTSSSIRPCFNPSSSSHGR